MTHPEGRPAALVVDDEPLIEMEAVDLLEDLGYDTTGSRNADEALSILESRSDITLVFTDIEMPGSMNGLALCALVETTWPHIQVIVTSGRIMAPGAALLGKAYFCTKPYDSRQIEVALAAFGPATPRL